MTEQDRQPIMDIFNYYIENSFAAYPEKKLPYEAFDIFLQMSDGYPSATVRDDEGKVLGFGLLRAYNRMSSFARTVEITYFLDHAHIGNGMGKDLLHHLEDKGKQKGIKNILANISSLNPISLAFHQKNGFVECGRFKRIGIKNGTVFDVIWMQKTLA